MEPWLDKRRDKKGKIMTSPDGVTLYEGFCMDFLEKLSEYANFDYQIIVQGDSRVPGMLLYFILGVRGLCAESREPNNFLTKEPNQFNANSITLAKS